MSKQICPSLMHGLHSVINKKKKWQQSLMECLPCARHCSKWYSQIKSFHLNYPMKLVTPYTPVWCATRRSFWKKGHFPPAAGIAAGKRPSAVSCLRRFPWLKNTASPKVTLPSKEGLIQWFLCCGCQVLILLSPDRRDARLSQFQLSMGLAENFLGIASLLYSSSCPVLLPTFPIHIPQSTSL